MGEAPRPTPAQLAAAWRAFRGDRPGTLLGPGPGFAEAIGAAMALDPRVAELEAEVARLRAALEPFVRADRAIGAEPGPFRFETANGYRLIEREHLRAAALATRETTHA